MKKSIKCLAAVFGAAALAAAAFGICLAMGKRDALPVLSVTSQGAQCAAAEMLRAVEEGAYDEASCIILGEPDLGVDREADGAVGRLLWDAYQESLEFEPLGELFTTENGVAQRYAVRYLNVESVASNLRVYAEPLLQKRVEEAENVSEVYDEKNEYREDVVTEVLCEAAEKALQEKAVYIDREFVVSLTGRDGRWWVIPDAQLLSAISGGLTE